MTDFESYYKKELNNPSLIRFQARILFDSLRKKFPERESFTAEESVEMIFQTDISFFKQKIRNSFSNYFINEDPATLNRITIDQGVKAIMKVHKSSDEDIRSKFDTVKLTNGYIDLTGYLEVLRSVIMPE